MNLEVQLLALVAASKRIQPRGARRAAALGGAPAAPAAKCAGARAAGAAAAAAKLFGVAFGGATEAGGPEEGRDGTESHSDLARVYFFGGESEEAF